MRNGKPAANGVHWTPVETKMLQLLSDGKPHTREELHGCLWDDKSYLRTIQFHLSKIRQRLRPQGQDIICELFKRQIHYRHIRYLASD